MSNAQRSIEIAVPLDRLFEVVQDFARYPEFIPEMKRVNVIRKDASGQEIEFELEIDLPIVKKRIKYTLTFVEEKPHTVRWKLVKGDFMKSNTGSWTFRALGDNLTEATYAIDISFGALVPKAISNFLAEQSLPRMLAQFKGRSEGLLKELASKK